MGETGIKEELSTLPSLKFSCILNNDQKKTTFWQQFLINSYVILSLYKHI